ncbi:PDC sensor domain-containing protein [Actinoplanes aureus]|uniref:PDC sensor domain-containing protein n=1 Tax=Actinoplanes aureus TaxID=2792083 RepID=UPI001E64930B|nr:PDC sensor domain-containing protein [Actinoplanes aureus]
MPLTLWLLLIQLRHALASLSDPVAGEQDFTRVVAGFGFPAAVLLDLQGEVLHVAPAKEIPLKHHLTKRYPYLAIAVRQGTPVVSAVLSSIAGSVPVINFAVPFDTVRGTHGG